jgi:hypothetical protein
MRINRLAALSLAAFLLWSPACQADSSDRNPQMRAIATTGVLYGSLYATVVVAVQTLRVAIMTVTPVAIEGTVQMLGIPAAMVVLMAQLVPTLRSSVPPMVDQWFGDAAADGGSPPPRL